MVETIDLYRRIRNAVAVVETRKRNDVGYVVANETYVNVGEEKGLNGTAVTVNSIDSAIDAIVYPTQEDAYKFGQDFYLKNGYGEVRLEIMPSDVYFEGQLKIAKSLMDFMTRKSA